MSINRSLWKSAFTIHEPPKWPCPSCDTGHVELLKESLKHEEVASESWIRGDGESGHTEYAFVAIFVCKNEQCKERVVTCGRGYLSVNRVYNEYEEVLYDRDGEEMYSRTDWFLPEYFYPCLKIFRIPPRCPDAVTNKILDSFKVFFCDPASSANHVRKCVENILTDKGVKRFETKNGRRIFINLHNRINLYHSKEREIVEYLLAIKWLGNVASHIGVITRDDVLDAYEILETVLDNLYVGHAKNVRKKVKLVNRRKGPIKK